MKYRILLFDADGTLLDFRKSEAVGLNQVFDTFAIPNQDACRTYYLDLNEVLWKGFEQGEFPKEHIFDVRFQMMLDHFGIEGDGKAMEACYRHWLNKGSHTISGALPLVQELSQTYDLYIVTNGVSKTQYQRLSESGLLPYFKAVFVSEDTGYQKPQKEYFDYVLHHIQEVPEEMLLIGDSLSSDILGANRANIAACWYNPEHCINQSEAIVDYEIHALEELWTIL